MLDIGHLQCSVILHLFCIMCIWSKKKNLSLFWIIQSNFFRLFTHTSHLLYWSKSFHCSRSLKRWCVLFPNIDTFIYHKMCPQILQLLTTGQKQYVKLGLILWPYYSNQRVQNNVYIIIYINRKLKYEGLGV